MPNFSFLACLEVAEKFVVGGGGGVDLTYSLEKLSYVVRFHYVVDMVDLNTWAILREKKWNNSAFTGGWLGWLGRQIFILEKTEKYWSFSKKKSTVFDFTSGWLGWLHFLGIK